MCFDPVSATALLLASERGCNRGCGRCCRNHDDERPCGDRRCQCCCCCSCRENAARDRECEERAEREAEQRRCEEMAAARAEARENRGCDCVRPASASAPCTSDVLRPAATCWSRPISSCR